MRVGRGFSGASCLPSASFPLLRMRFRSPSRFRCDVGLRRLKGRGRSSGHSARVNTLLRLLHRLKPGGPGACPAQGRGRRRLGRLRRYESMTNLGNLNLRPWRDR